MPARTLAQKLWDSHVVRTGAAGDEPDLLYVDLHLVHEVTSAQAFEGLRMTGRHVRRPDLTVATMDHNVPTRGGVRAADELSRKQMEVLAENCEREGIPLHKIGSRRQGIVHIIGPELGLSQPGMVIVCGDSHTSTHGAFGALAFGIGTSEVELVLATQCLPQRRPGDLAVNVEGELPIGVTAKDIALGLIGRAGTSGGIGHLVEYRGSTVRGLTMEGRLTLCNMSIEWGAKAGMVAPDDTTFKYMEGRPHAPRGSAWHAALDYWRSLRPERAAEDEGLDLVFKAAGFEWRNAGCSMCLGMNPDILAPGERCASTSNRNFEGRQGAGGRTHLVSPPMAAAAAITGHLVDVRELV